MYHSTLGLSGIKKNKEAATKNFRGGLALPEQNWFRHECSLVALFTRFPALNVFYGAPRIYSGRAGEAYRGTSHIRNSPPP